MNCIYFDSNDDNKSDNSKAGDSSRGRPEGSLFKSYYTKV